MTITLDSDARRKLSTKIVQPAGARQRMVKVNFGLEDYAYLKRLAHALPVGQRRGISGVVRSIIQTVRIDDEANEP